MQCIPYTSAAQHGRQTPRASRQLTATHLVRVPHSLRPSTFPIITTHHYPSHHPHLPPNPHAHQTPSLPTPTLPPCTIHPPGPFATPTGCAALRRAAPLPTAQPQPRRPSPLQRPGTRVSHRRTAMRLMPTGGVATATRLGGWMEGSHPGTAPMRAALETSHLRPGHHKCGGAGARGVMSQARVSVLGGRGGEMCRSEGGERDRVIHC